MRCYILIRCNTLELKEILIEFSVEEKKNTTQKTHKNNINTQRKQNKNTNNLIGMYNLSNDLCCCICLRKYDGYVKM